MPVDPKVARARELLGIPFRLHGREPAGGLDCAGLVALLYGLTENVPTGYALRNGEGVRWHRALDRHFLRRADCQMDPGDIALMQAGPAQFHLGIWTGEGLIHADARLRRVVEIPGPIAWPVLGVWRAPQGTC